MFSRCRSRGVNRVSCTRAVDMGHWACFINVNPSIRDWRIWNLPALFLRMGLTDLNLSNPCFSRIEREYPSGGSAIHGQLMDSRGVFSETWNINHNITTNYHIKVYSIVLTQLYAILAANRQHFKINRRRELIFWFWSLYYYTGKIRSETGLRLTDWH